MGWGEVRLSLDTEYRLDLNLEATSRSGVLRFPSVDGSAGAATPVNPERRAASHVAREVGGSSGCAFPVPWPSPCSGRCCFSLERQGLGRSAGRKPLLRPCPVAWVCLKTCENRRWELRHPHGPQLEGTQPLTPAGLPRHPRSSRGPLGEQVQGAGPAAHSLSLALPGPLSVLRVGMQCAGPFSLLPSGGAVLASTLRLMGGAPARCRSGGAGSEAWGCPGMGYRAAPAPRLGSGRPPPWAGGLLGA